MFSRGLSIKSSAVGVWDLHCRAMPIMSVKECGYLSVFKTHSINDCFHTAASGKQPHQSSICPSISTFHHFPAFVAGKADLLDCRNRSLTLLCISMGSGSGKYIQVFRDQKINHKLLSILWIISLGQGHPLAWRKKLFVLKLCHQGNGDGSTSYQQNCEKAASFNQIFFSFPNC